MLVLDSKTQEVRRTFSRFQDKAYSGNLRCDGKLLVAGGETGVVQVGPARLCHQANYACPFAESSNNQRLCQDVLTPPPPLLSRSSTQVAVLSSGSSRATKSLAMLPSSVTTRPMSSQVETTSRCRLPLALSLFP